MNDQSQDLPARHRRWTTKEIDYLKENIGYRRIQDIALTLDRTETAVVMKMKRLGIGLTRTLSGKITSGELAELLDVDRNTVRWWICHHNLPATRKITRKTRKYTLISPESFWIWAEKNREKIDFNKFDKNTLPPEPAWVEIERKNPSFQGRTYQEWTTKSDEELASYIDKGLSYKEIGQIMNRSMNSIEKRYHRIRKMHDYYKGEKPYAISPGERIPNTVEVKRLKAQKDARK